MRATRKAAVRQRQDTRVRRAAAVIAAGLVAATLTVGTPAAAMPDVATDSTVLDWNRYTFDALSNPPIAAIPGIGQPPNVAVLHVAMVQGAVYDAVNSIVGGRQPYLKGIPAAPATASQRAAAAQAAHDVLLGLQVPSAPSSTSPGALVPLLPASIRIRLDVLLAQTLATVPDGGDEDAGVAAGRAAAVAMLSARGNDGRYVPLELTAGTAPGEWRPTPPRRLSDPNAWVSKVRPFVIRSADQYRTDGPLDLSSRAYAREYNEVKRLGAVDSKRNKNQDAVARFFNVNSLELPHRTFRTIAAGLTLPDQARLFAQLGLAGADAVISCWNEKVYWGFWRPITAIHEGDTDTNPWTDGDTTWTPLEEAPPYSDHTSGYNCITAATMYTGRAFFGRDRMEFDIYQFAGGTEFRHYRRFSDVVEDTIDARVYQGIHFRTADEQGAELGRNVAEYVAEHALRAAR